MGGDSSASASDPQGLPLIWCTECGMRQVVRRISQKTWSLGRVFYLCTRYKCDGAGCPFWFWEEEYVDMLVGKRGNGDGQGSRSNVGRAIAQEDYYMKSEATIGVGHGVVNKEAEFVGLMKEAVVLMKAIFISSVCILFVMLLSLFVQLMK
ncbi:hypothetical protein SEVIR_4G120000v4 [Setaria viridis]|uniref:GRF-type domain-containing protein n=2 Tax=Setaria TaxID=4554 RepID=A0A368QUL1_SETIT|nr:uncharacterized protein LOC117851687 [Setaria viridis]RCV21631.1 hypothetical protein SETIT_4G153300v2 [Setaria italica]